MEALTSSEVRALAEELKGAPEPSLRQMLELGRVLAEACGADELARRLAAETLGWEGIDEHDLPDERRVAGFASPFPVRALELGLLDPEEVFLVNREKFSQVSLALPQPVQELEAALRDLGEAGVLALRVPASEVNERSADTDASDQVYIYVLPREIRRILDSARREALRALTERLVEAATS